MFSSVESNIVKRLDSINICADYSYVLHVWRYVLSVLASV